MTDALFYTGRHGGASLSSATQAVQIIDVSEHKPRRIPSAKWRELIKKVWEADPLLCPRCSKEMKIVSLIDDRAVIERILGDPATARSTPLNTNSCHSCPLLVPLLP